MASGAGFQLAGSASERYERYVAPVMAPFVEALLDAAELRAGEAVLELACGTGFTARRAVPRVSPGGRVVCADLDAGMLEIARRVAPELELVGASAEALPFPDASFDAVVCQQGMQFFPDLRAAVREAARVLRPGGRLAATTWAPLEQSPYFAAQHAAIAAVVGDEVSAPFLAAFACSAEQLGSALHAAGFEVVSERKVVAELALPATEEWIAGHLSALPWGAPVIEANALGRYTAAIRGRLEPHITDGAIRAPFASWLVTARAPRPPDRVAA